MMISLKQKASGLKYALFFIAAILMGYQIYTAYGHEESNYLFQNSFSTRNILFISFCLFLVPVNWFLESLKWRILMEPFIKISSGQAFKSILAGLSLGIVTPSRIGEYGGRILMTPYVRSHEVISSTFAGSLAQNITHIMAGILLAFFILKDFWNNLYVQPAFFFSAVCLQACVMLAVYFYFSKITDYMAGQNLPEKLKKIFMRAGDVYPKDVRLLLKIWMISLIRYGVYFIQYLLVLSALHIEVKNWEVVSHLASIFLIQTLIPLPAFISVPARGEVAVLVWQNAGIHAVHALTATYTIWFINLIIPAIFGLVILIKSVKNQPQNNSDTHPFVAQESP